MVLSSASTYQLLANSACWGHEARPFFSPVGVSVSALRLHARVMPVLRIVTPSMVAVMFVI